MANMTYRQLQQAVTNVGKNVAREGQEVRSFVWLVNKESTDTSRVAEMIAGMRVDSATVAETRELAKVMVWLSQAGTAYAASSDTTFKAAKAAHEQAHLSHNGINEAVGRSDVDGIHDVNREWLRQE